MQRFCFVLSAALFIGHLIVFTSEASKRKTIEDEVEDPVFLSQKRAKEKIEHTYLKSKRALEEKKVRKYLNASYDKKKKKKVSRRRQLDHKDKKPSTRSKKKAKPAPLAIKHENQEYNYLTITSLIPTDIWFILMQDYLDARSFARMKQVCSYFNELTIYPRKWEALAHHEGVLYHSLQTNFEQLVKGHFLIPKCFPNSSYSPTQNFFFEVMQLSRAMRLGNLEAAFHLRGLLEFRGHHYISNPERHLIYAKVNQAMQGLVEKLEESTQEIPTKFLILGSAYRYGQGVPQDIATGMDLFVDADEMGDPRASLEIGRLYERPPRANMRSKKEAIHFYRKAGERGSSLGYIKLGYLYLRSYSYKKARKSFKKAIEMGDARGHRGLYILEKGIEDSDWVELRGLQKSDKHLDAYIQSGDSYALVLKAERLHPSHARDYYDSAWCEGLTSDRILKGALPFMKDFELRMRFRSLVDSGYLNVINGILDHNPQYLGTAMAQFTASGHTTFVEAIGNLLRSDFN